MSEMGSERTMEGKVCLVTGATSGIGRVTARELARRGARVYIVGRSAEKCDEVVREVSTIPASTPVEVFIADLSSRAAVRGLAGEILGRCPKLDVLINNAGGIFLERRESVDRFEMTFALNHLAYFQLTSRLLPLLKAPTPTRILNLSSEAHRGVTLDFDDLQNQRHYRGFRAYQQSKLANLLFTYELALRLAGTEITVNALHPGFVRTSIFRDGGWAGWTLRRLADMFATSPEKGARTSVYLATAQDMERISGKYFVREKAAESSRASHDETAAKRLWEISETLTETIWGEAST